MDCLLCHHEGELHVLRDREGMPEIDPCRVRIIDASEPKGYRRCGCTEDFA